MYTYVDVRLNTSLANAITKCVSISICLHSVRLDSIREKERCVHLTNMCFGSTIAVRSVHFSYQHAMQLRRMQWKQ